MSQLIFDKYEIQHRLAVGGMGEVFYAVQRGAVRGFERPVILKNLLPDLASQEGFIEQFLDEARVAATLNHPNVVSIYEVGQWNGVYFIAMEYIPGKNLSQLVKASLKKNLPIPPAVIAKIVHDAALGLDHAHHAVDSQGQPLNIVHRDISPQNIMVRGDGVTKVVDFGIARASNRSTRTATGAIKGKLAYMAPEQVRSRNIDGLADEFALGVVLWELCARKRLFRAERDIDLIRMVLEQPITRLSEVVPGLPEDLDEIVDRMTRRNPAERYQRLSAVAQELAHFLVKFSPPSAESPVGQYMQLLGDEEIDITRRATPSQGNFVISLKGTPAGPPPELTGGPPRPPADALQTRTTPSRVPGSPERRRSKLPFVALGAVVLAGLGVAGGWYAMRAGPAVEAVAAVNTVPLPPPKPQTVERPVEIAPVPHAARLEVVSVPAGAALRVNGRKQGETPQTFDAPPGATVMMAFEKPGFRSEEREVTAKEGELLRVEVKLTKRTEPVAVAPKPAAAATAAPSEPGFVSLDSAPWTRVTIDGAPVGSTPIFKSRLSAGRHVVVFTAEGGASVTREIDVKPGETAKLKVEVK